MNVQGPRTPVAGLPPTATAKPESLRTRGQFGVTLRTGRRERRPLITVVGRANDLEQTRVGYAVGRRVGGAVVRNRVRRRLRELMRHHLGILEGGRGGVDSGGWDVVVTAQPAAAGASFAQLGSEVQSALRGLAQHRSRHRVEGRPKASGKVPGTASGRASDAGARV